ncbi:hypothetical protein AJ88_15460 [Mesorhizobium amorphae CCBAU 01583]|nr:hypothetical protein AJ88_15460 [Mesorhizobium amorphae CCBAU 01583]
MRGKLLLVRNGTKRVPWGRSTKERLKSPTRPISFGSTKIAPASIHTFIGIFKWGTKPLIGGMRPRLFSIAIKLRR